MYSGKPTGKVTPPTPSSFNRSRYRVTACIVFGESKASPRFELAGNSSAPKIGEPVPWPMVVRVALKSSKLDLSVE